MSFSLLVPGEVAYPVLEPLAQHIPLHRPSLTAPQALDGCRATPQFVAAVASSPTMALATDGRELGLVLRSPTGDAPAYQHPTWDDAGYLGAIAYDQLGNVYAVPRPRLSLVDSPLAGAATLWQADTATGALRPFVTLPGVASARNPFGTTDVMGVLVVRQGEGYVLYAGLARRPVIIALPLDAEGQPAGAATTLIDLADAGATPQERARKLRLVNGDLVAELVPFTFSLQANATDTPQLRCATDEKRLPTLLRLG